MRDLNYQLKQLCQRNRDGGAATQALRERNLSLIANQLQELGYRHMTPQSIKPKHVDALVRRWKEEGLATGTIKNRMAHLRWWAEKVDKRSVIPHSNDKLNIERRSYVPTESKAWDLSAAQLARVTDERIKLSLELQYQFGLRTEESIKFQPAYADKGDHIQLKGSWCKGGQARTIPVRTAEQRELLARVHQVAKRGSLIPREFSYIAQLTRFKEQCYRAEMHNFHGLRHSYAQRRYQELTGWPPPIAGGPNAAALTPEQKQRDYEARMVVSEELGHHREQITVAYLGR